MYEKLTRHIPALEADYPDSLEDLYAFNHDVNEFVLTYDKADLRMYAVILEAKGIEGPLEEVDFSGLDAEAVLAMVVYELRADHFAGFGYIDRFVEDGTIVRWLKRLEELEELDENEKGRAESRKKAER